MPLTASGSGATNGTGIWPRSLNGGAAPTDPIIFLTIATTMTAILIADLYTPLGITVWVVYIAPVALSMMLRRPTLPLMLAAGATVLMAVTFVTDAPGVDRSMALVNRLFGFITVLVTAIIGFFFVRNKLAVQRQEWLQTRQVGLSLAMGGEQRQEQLGENVLRYLAEQLDAQVGVFFVRNGAGFTRVASYCLPADAPVPQSFDEKDGLLGQSARDARPFVVEQVPDNYFVVGSSLGHGKPRHLLIVPAVSDKGVNAVFELGFVHSMPPIALDLVERVADSIAVAVRSAQYRAHLQNLLEETQRQAEELQVQGEELRVANEELEEQGRSLRESQGRLEEQQAELEQTNAQLELQTQLLEGQRKDLAKANEHLEAQAGELDRASRYKSDFLANMSHELRTPLNSTLILAKLLADNPDGNLNDEQVRYARTIQSAGNDLLTLINDILDLSKIEAGRMEVHAERVVLPELAENLRLVFQPIADQKKLTLSIDIAPEAPETIETDRLRLEQILKNLLANAIKFTEQGSVSLKICPAPERRVALSIVDTGVGVPRDQHQLIFEAFRQADGAANRKHGGTGLGLSISRELARLLGGEIQLVSEPGMGSTFTVVLPTAYDADRTLARSPSTPTSSLPAASPPAAAAVDRPVSLPALKPSPTSLPPPAWRVANGDRQGLSSSSRVLLVVEDDPSFAQILVDLAHDQGFRCVVASSAEGALAAAVDVAPHAVVLDIGLPDHSGLSVLDRLKHDPRTRHIPVHIVSGSDHAEAALSLGAIGYMLKPVKREDLDQALRRLESKLSQRMRRVLVVEDDRAQREALERLLASHEVQTVGAGSAAECLQRLRSEMFDCMVLDLTLPDATGYALLETLSGEDGCSFPPVIVYTGRDLSADEEQRLRRYSKSIIIKGAKSPERLLDEVTLFLHQVVADLPAEQQRLLAKARSRDAAIEGKRILVVEDDVRNVFALSSILEPRGASVEIARNGLEAIAALERADESPDRRIDLILMDVMMPEMDGLTATREIRRRPGWKKLPILMLTAKAMRDDQQRCLDAGANDYMAKPLDVEKLLSLVRVWMPR